MYKVVVLFLFFASSRAFAASHVVQPGENLTVIARATSTSVVNLSALNSIPNPDKIMPGQKIKYVTDEDIAAAKEWSKKRIGELSWGEDREYFEFALRCLENMDLRYSIYEPNGLHANTLLCFADAWRNFKGAC